MHCFYQCPPVPTPSKSLLPCKVACSQVPGIRTWASSVAITLSTCAHRSILLPRDPRMVLHLPPAHIFFPFSSLEARVIFSNLNASLCSLSKPSQGHGPTGNSLACFLTDRPLAPSAPVTLFPCDSSSVPRLPICRCPGRSPSVLAWLCHWFHSGVSDGLSCHRVYTTIFPSCGWFFRTFLKLCCRIPSF